MCSRVDCKNHEILKSALCESRKQLVKLKVLSNLKKRKQL